MEYSFKLGLWLATTPLSPMKMIGIGGQTPVHLASGTLTFKDSHGLHPVPLIFQIPEEPRVPRGMPAPPPMPNLLGANVWGLGNLTIDRPRSQVLLDLPPPTGP